MPRARECPGTAADGERRLRRDALTVSIVDTLDGGEEPIAPCSLPSIGFFAHGDVTAACKPSRVPTVHGQLCKPPSGGQ